MPKVACSRHLLRRLMLAAFPSAWPSGVQHWWHVRGAQSSISVSRHMLSCLLAILPLVSQGRSVIGCIPSAVHHVVQFGSMSTTSDPLADGCIVSSFHAHIQGTPWVAAYLSLAPSALHVLFAHGSYSCGSVWQRVHLLHDLLAALSWIPSACLA